MGWNGSGHTGGYTRRDKLEAMKLYAVGVYRREIAKKIGCSMSSIDRWRADKDPRDWDEFKEIIERELDARAEAMVDEIAAMDELQAFWGRKLFEQTCKEAEGIAHDNPYTAALSAKVWAHLERTARGEPTEHTQVKVIKVPQFAEGEEPDSGTDSDGA